jgi:hypothetical protein
MFQECTSPLNGPWVKARVQLPPSTNRRKCSAAMHAADVAAGTVTAIVDVAVVAGGGEATCTAVRVVADAVDAGTSGGAAACGGACADGAGTGGNVLAPREL